MQAYLEIKKYIETRRNAVEITLRDIELSSVLEKTGRERRPYRIGSSNAAKKFFIVIRKIWTEFDSINAKIKSYNNLLGLILYWY